MAKEVNKKGGGEIDEQFLISMMAKEEPTSAATTKAAKEDLPEETSPKEAKGSPRKENDNVSENRNEPESKKKKARQADYETLFLKNSEETARYGKTIYIRKEFHERVQRIVQVLGDNEISLYSYIDNVLLHHFDTFQNEIREGYEKKQKPII